MAREKIESLILILGGVGLSIYFWYTVPPDKIELALIIPGSLIGAGLDQWKDGK